MPEGTKKTADAAASPDTDVLDDATVDATSPTSPNPNDHFKLAIKDRDTQKRRARAAEAERDQALQAFRELKERTEAEAAQRDAEFDVKRERIEALAIRRAHAVIAENVDPRLHAAAKAVFASEDLVELDDEAIVRRLHELGLYRARSGGSPGTPGINFAMKPESELPENPNGADEDPRLARVRAIAQRDSARLRGERPDGLMTRTPQQPPKREPTQADRDRARALGQKESADRGVSGRFVMDEHGNRYALDENGKATKVRRT